MNSPMAKTKKNNRRCERCGLLIADEAWHCPLCRGALITDTVLEAGAARSLVYPDVSRRIKKMRLAIKITVFASVIIAAVLILINYLTFSGIYWSFLAVAVLVYGCVTLIASFRVRKSAQFRIIFQLILAAVLVYALDRILGYSGWSVRFGFPIILLVADAIAVVLMLTNIHGWQTYIVTEIWAGVLGVILILLELTGVWKLSVLGIIAAAVSVLLPVGTILFGQTMILEDVKRRFKL